MVLTAILERILVQSNIQQGRECRCQK